MAIKTGTSSKTATLAVVGLLAGIGLMAAVALQVDSSKQKQTKQRAQQATDDIRKELSNAKGMHFNVSLMRKELVKIPSTEIYCTPKATIAGFQSISKVHDIESDHHVFCNWIDDMGNDFSIGDVRIDTKVITQNLSRVADETTTNLYYKPGKIRTTVFRGQKDTYDFLLNRNPLFEKGGSGFGEITIGIATPDGLEEQVIGGSDEEGGWYRKELTKKPKSPAQAINTLLQGLDYTSGNLVKLESDGFKTFTFDTKAQKVAQLFSAFGLDYSSFLKEDPNNDNPVQVQVKTREDKTARVISIISKDIIFSIEFDAQTKATSVSLPYSIYNPDPNKATDAPYLVTADTLNNFCTHYPFTDCDNFKSTFVSTLDAKSKTLLQEPFNAANWVSCALTEVPEEKPDCFCDMFVMPITYNNGKPVYDFSAASVCDGANPPQYCYECQELFAKNDVCGTEPADDKPECYCDMFDMPITYNSNGEAVYNFNQAAECSGSNPSAECLDCQKLFSTYDVCGQGAEDELEEIIINKPDPGTLVVPEDEEETSAGPSSGGTDDPVDVEIGETPTDDPVDVDTTSGN